MLPFILNTFTRTNLRAAVLLPSVLCLLFAVTVDSQTPTPTPPGPTHADILRGEYGKYRANNDLLAYDLTIKVDPSRNYITGTNSIQFKMLSDDTRIQLDLYDNLYIDHITMAKRELKYERDSGAVFVDFPTTLQKGQTYTIAFEYHGTPKTIGRFGGFTFGKDPKGRPWVFTACEGLGASLWWPNKDQWKDEVNEMWMHVIIPNGLTDVSNGRFLKKRDLGDGFTQWDYHINYPINNYDVSLNIGNYEHWSDKLDDLTLDFYALPEDLEKAKAQFIQAKGMLKAYQFIFGEYPFKKDGYKLIQVPYSGMEHQSAVTYGNRFANGYLERDWTGVGISTRFDFIIIHESGHEWFGNAVTAADVSDMWIHEGWTTYLECLYVEYRWAHDDYLKYTNALKKKVQNRTPIITHRGTNTEPPQDMYFKGALFLHTLRSVIDDDRKFYALIRDLFQKFKYQTIMTEDLVAFFNDRTGMDLTPVFDQYLRHAAIPVLELKFTTGMVAYRWKADEPAFSMPIKVGAKDNWRIIKPTTEWQTMQTPLTKDTFDVATDLYYVDIAKL
ncbi:MAG: M1 family metallopeptidase [Acidobacteria bacterium]|nr:M1 family metallopeptidase [Acidobacteriota bacterium]